MSRCDALAGPGAPTYSCGAWVGPEAKNAIRSTDSNSTITAPPALLILLLNDAMGPPQGFWVWSCFLAIFLLPSSLHWSSPNYWIFHETDNIIVHKIMAFKYIHLLVSSDYIDCNSTERIFTKKVIFSAFMVLKNAPFHKGTMEGLVYIYTT